MALAPVLALQQEALVLLLTTIPLCSNSERLNCRLPRAAEACAVRVSRPKPEKAWFVILQGWQASNRVVGRLAKLWQRCGVDTMAHKRSLIENSRGKMFIASDSVQWSGGAVASRFFVGHKC